MPIIDIKVFKDELSTEQSAALIRRVTDAVVAETSEKLREVTWVTVTEVKDGHWGVGGKAIGLPDVQAMIAS